jgi:hypothetical protein
MIVITNLSTVIVTNSVGMGDNTRIYVPTYRIIKCTELDMEPIEAASQ